MNHPPVREGRISVRGGGREARAGRLRGLGVLFVLHLVLVALVGCGATERVVVPVDVSHVEPPNPYATNGAEPIDVHAAGEPIDGPLFLSETVPDWAADAVFYQLFPERFRNGDPSNDPTRASLEFPIERVPENWAVTPWTSDWYARADWETARGDDFYDNGVFDRRYGGDLQGVIDQLDYLADLGINAIYFNPVFYARSLHKYDGNSFHHVDPYFGPDPEGDLALMATETSDPETWHWTAADRLFLDLIREAHARGIRVVIDGVFNHTGRDFFAFEDLRKNQAASPYADWYIVERWDDPATDEDEFALQGLVGRPHPPRVRRHPGRHDLHPGPKRIRLRRDGAAGWTPTATAIRATASTAGGSTSPTRCR
jgi:cyclomaltodextrinase / maltogenic alpha-amylase / neopullulanase